MRIIDVAIGVIVRQGKVLISRRRSDGTFPGYWEFPGGKCEPNETPQQCLTRELREELATTAAVMHAFDAIEHQYPTVHVRLHPFLCRHEATEPQAIACDELLWVEPKQLRQYRFPEANSALIEQVITKLDSGCAGP